MSHLQSQSSEVEFELSHEQEKSDSNLLDSLTPTPNKRPSSQKNPKIEEKPEDDEQFLGDMEEVLGGSSNSRKMSKEEIVLQAQVIQLQMKCNSLSIINAKLMANLNKVKTDSDSSGGKDQQKSQGGGKINNSADNSCIVGDITQMQSEFTQIQDILNAYRAQLTSYQDQIAKQNSHTEEMIDSLNQQIREVERQNYLKQKECSELKKNNLQINRENQMLLKQNNLLRKKNEELIIDMEGLNTELQQLQKWKKQKCLKKGRENHNYLNKSNNMHALKSIHTQSIYSSQYDENPSITEDHDRETENGVILQMEKIIDELASRLEYERELCKKYTAEIRRINEEMRNEEIKIQKKNQQIYKLEKQILALKKSIMEGQYRRNLEDENRRGDDYRNSLEKDERHCKSSQKQKEEHRKSIDRESANSIQIPLNKEENYHRKHESHGLKSEGRTFLAEQKKLQALEDSKMNKNVNRVNSPTKKPTMSANIYQIPTSPTSPTSTNTSNNHNPKNSTNADPPNTSSPANNDEQLHRKTLQQVLEEQCSPLLMLIICKRVLQLYTQTEEKNQNRTVISPQNLQVYNMFYDNLELLRIRIIHTQPGNTLASKEDYFFNVLHLLLSLIENYSFDKVQSLLNELQDHPLNQKAKNMASHFTYVRLAIDSAILKTKKEKTNVSLN